MLIIFFVLFLYLRLKILFALLISSSGIFELCGSLPKILSNIFLYASSSIFPQMVTDYDVFM